jgi:hypothetical protein
MIRRILDFLFTLEGLEFALILVVGFGLIGYVSASWAMYYWSIGKFPIAALIIFFTIALFLAALIRVPIVNLAIWGGSFVLGSIFLSGGSSGLMP